MNVSTEKGKMTRTALITTGKTRLKSSFYRMTSILDSAVHEDINNPFKQLDLLLKYGTNKQITNRKHT